MYPGERFLNAVFGGPRLTDEHLQTLMRRHRLPEAAIVHACAEKTPSGDAAAIPLPLHPGLVCWFSPLEEATPVPPGFEPVAYRQRATLVAAVQQAIVARRREELAALRQSGSGSFSLHDEGRAFQLALHEIRRNPAGSGDALGDWVEIMFHRGQREINLIRLRLVELLTAMTRGHQGRFAYLSASLIKTIYSEHSLPRLAHLARTIVAELAPLTLGAPALPGEQTVSPAVRKALAVMAETFRTRTSLAEVAAASHVSAAHLARLFRKETGQSVVEHLHRLRINHARELLATTSLGVLEVAMESGFESIEHFHRLFRRLTGTTPRLYRFQAGQR